jgi:hypothetical protein
MVAMYERNLILAPDEQQYLVTLLKSELKQTRVEAHRTRTPNYRRGIIQNEQRILSLLDKLGEPRETIMGS